MTTSTTQSDLETQARRVQSYLDRQRPTIAGVVAWYGRLIAEGQEKGLEPAQLFGAAAAERQDGMLASARNWLKVLLMLDGGYAELVAVKRGSEPISWAVRRIGDGKLGYWAVALQLVKLAAGATIAGASWLLGDAYLETQKTVAETALVEARTRASLAELAKQYPQIAPQIADAVASADRAKADAERGIFDVLGDTVKGAAGGFGAGALLALGLYLVLESRKRRGRQ